MRKYAFLLTLTIAVLFTFTACGNNDESYGDSEVNYEYTSNTEQTTHPNPVEIDSIVHQFSYLGFSIALPASWEGKYGIQETSTLTAGSIRIYHIATREEFGSGEGELFRIARAPSYSIDVPLPPGFMVLALHEGYEYSIGHPFDSVHGFDPTTPMAIEFFEMLEYAMDRGNNSIINSFRIVPRTATTQVQDNPVTP